MAGEQKMQPAAIVNVEMSTPSDELLGGCWASQDFAFENKDLRLVYSSDLIAFLKSSEFIEIAEYQIKQVIDAV